MAVDAGEIGQFGYSIEARINDEMTRKLGAEAAERFFNQLPAKLTRRTKALAHQAKVLSYLESVDEPVKLESVESTEVEDAAVIDLAEHVHNDSNIPDEETPGLMSLDASDDSTTIAEMQKPEFLPVYEVQQEELVREVDSYDEWVLSERLASFTDGIVLRHGGAKQLGLKRDDKEAYISALMSLRGKTKNTKAFPPSRDALDSMYDGETRAESAARFNVTAQTISNRLALLQANIAKNVKAHGTDVYAYLEEKIRIGRGEETTSPVATSAQGAFHIEAQNESLEMLEGILGDTVQKTDEEAYGRLYTREPEPQFKKDVATVPTVSDERSGKLAQMNNSQLRDLFFAYLNESAQGSEVKSTWKLLDRKDTFTEEVDYAFGRSTIRRLIDSDRGQVVYNAMPEQAQDWMRLVSGYELNNGEKTQTMKRLVDSLQTWKQKEAEHTLLVSLTKMIPYVEDSKKDADLDKALDETKSWQLIENLDLNENINLFNVVIYGEEITPEKLEAGINNVFVRAVNAGVFTEAQATYLRRRVKGSEEVEERATGEKSAEFIFSQLTDRYGIKLQTIPEGDDNGMSQVLRGLLSQFRSNKSLAYMENVVAEAQTAVRKNAFKQITVDKVPIVLAAAICDVVESAIGKTKR